MEFALERKGYRQNEEEEGDDDDDEGDEREEIRGSSKFPLSSSCSYSSSNPKPYDHYSSKRQIHQEYYCEEQVPGAGTRSHMQEDHSICQGAGKGKGGDHQDGEVDREHMFDKVVTPSDVGKLNRLVIPKQHAEKYFPLHPSSSAGGALLDFEDRNGKEWRFRYSYWNSSQSYVMTKGWSRFVKEKKLSAGDIVSFNRSSGVGVGGDCRLFIDWRHQPKQQEQQQLLLHQYPHLSSSSSSTSSSLLHPSLLLPPGYDHLQQQQHLIMNNFNNYLQRPYFDHHHHHPHHHPYHHHLHHQRGAGYGYGGEMKNVGPSIGSIYNIRSIGMDSIPMVINSVPVLHPMNPPTTTASSGAVSSSPKRGLRLFGVNMEEYCPIKTDDIVDDDHESKSRVLPSVPFYTMPSSLLSSSNNSSHHLHYHLPSSSSSLLRPPPPLRPTLPMSRSTGKTSLSFDLHLSDSD